MTAYYVILNIVAGLLIAAVAVVVMARPWRGAAR